MSALARSEVGVRSFDRERTHELFAEYAATKLPETREELVLAHLNIVRYLALRFAHRGEPLDDLIQVGTIGLLKAIDRFDLGRGVEFSTYAMPTIVGEIKRYFRDKGWALRVPRRLQDLSLAINRVAENLSVELGRSATIDDIAERLSVSSEDVIEAQELGYAYCALSLDGEQASEGRPKTSTLVERIRTDDAGLTLLEEKASLQQACLGLDRRERVVIYLRFFQDMPQAEIARRMNVSQMHISRLQQRAIQKIRRSMLAEGEARA